MRKAAVDVEGELGRPIESPKLMRSFRSLRSQGVDVAGRFGERGEYWGEGGRRSCEAVGMSELRGCRGEGGISPVPSVWGRG